MWTGRALLVSLLLLIAAGPAQASWSIGANMGAAVHNPQAGDATTIIQWPGTPVAFAPGLRLGMRGASGTHEGYLDSGFLLLDGGGATEAIVQSSLNYQHNFGSPGRSRPYLTAGGGLLVISFDSDFGSGATVVSPVLGGGVGMQFPVSEDHGSVRLELRYDRITGGEDQGSDIEEAGLLGLRFGFDLWMR